MILIIIITIFPALYILRERFSGKLNPVMFLLSVIAARLLRTAIADTDVQLIAFHSMRYYIFEMCRKNQQSIAIPPMDQWVADLGELGNVRNEFVYGTDYLRNFRFGVSQTFIA